MIATDFDQTRDRICVLDGPRQIHRGRAAEADVGRGRQDTVGGRCIEHENASAAVGTLGDVHLIALVVVGYVHGVAQEGAHTGYAELFSCGHGAVCTGGCPAWNSDQRTIIRTTGCPHVCKDHQVAVAVVGDAVCTNEVVDGHHATGAYAAACLREEGVDHGDHVGVVDHGVQRIDVRVDTP